MLTVDDLKRLLRLEPLPMEGGLYAETYRSPIRTVGVLPEYDGERALATAIFYLLEPGACSRMHRLKGDELYHFYLGDPVELLMIEPGRAGEVVTLGPELEAGMRVQHLVPGRAWQGSRLRPGGRWALLGTTMAPGFDPRDFELGANEALADSCRAHADLLRALTGSS